MGAFEEIADRQIQAGRKAVLFDNLAGAGNPIRDLDRVRPPGWWASRIAARERSKIRSEDLAADVAAAMPSLWREPTEADVTRAVGAMQEALA